MMDIMCIIIDSSSIFKRNWFQCLKWFDAFFLSRENELNTLGSRSFLFHNCRYFIDKMINQIMAYRLQC